MYNKHLIHIILLLQVTPFSL